MWSCFPVSAKPSSVPPPQKTANFRGLQMKKLAAFVPVGSSHWHIKDVKTLLEVQGVYWSECWWGIRGEDYNRSRLPEILQTLLQVWYVLGRQSFSLHCGSEIVSASPCGSSSTKSAGRGVQHRAELVGLNITTTLTLWLGAAWEERVLRQMLCSVQKAGGGCQQSELTADHPVLWREI